MRCRIVFVLLLLGWPTTLIAQPIAVASLLQEAAGEDHVLVSSAWHEEGAFWTRKALAPDGSIRRVAVNRVG